MATVWWTCPACEVPVPKEHQASHWCKQQFEKKEDAP